MKPVLALDCGGTRLKAARVNADGGIEDLRHCATPDSLAGFRAAAAGMLRELHTPDVVAAGICSKGIIDASTSIVKVLPGTLHYLEGERLGDCVPPGLPVFADNDARAALAGECEWGAARGCADAILLTLGTGVGGGVLASGRILQGAGGIAGHLGHLTVEVDGEPCICGNRGCLETVFSARAIESAAHAAAHRGVASQLTRSSTCEDVFRLAAEGDAVAAGIIARRTRALGAAIAGLVLSLDPEIVVLGGQISLAGDPLVTPVREEVRARTWGLLRREVPVVVSALADPSGVAGAAALAFYGLARLE